MAKGAQLPKTLVSITNIPNIELHIYKVRCIPLILFKQFVTRQLWHISTILGVVRKIELHYYIYINYLCIYQCI